MARLPTQRLHDIVFALERIERRLAAVGVREGEALDDESLSIVAWSLLTAGEAIKSLPAEMIARHPDVDWRGLAGLRDRLAHQYFQIDQDMLRNIVRYDLPPLRAAVGEELRPQRREADADPD
jgi:uncharacterized protein with HEPN domain